MAFTDKNRDLALPAASADRSAFEGLYERWFQALYDFVLHTVHDADLAAGILRVTYSRAWDALRRGAAPYDVKSWLFGLAHDAAIDDIRHRSALLDSGADVGEQTEDLDFARVDPNRLVNPEPILRDRELVGLVWEAVETLSPKDYMLLDLHLRQGLTPDELTDALGLRRNTVQPMIARLREALEEAVTYALLLSRGRRECPDLDALLATMEGRGLRPETIRLIERHLGECAACRERKHRYPSPVEVFAALAALPASQRLRQSVWRRVSEYVRTSSAAPLVTPWWQERKVKIAALAAAVVVLAAIVITPFAASARNAVRDPSQVHSTSHQIGQPSGTRVVAITWDPQPQAQAFAVRWSQQPRDLPDANPDL
ncbi:MAG: RNA polymerase sigma factor, partial [Chloroflexota bacterium]